MGFWVLHLQWRDGCDGGTSCTVVARMYGEGAAAVQEGDVCCISYERDNGGME